MFQLLLIATSFVLISCGDKDKIVSHTITDVFIEKTFESNGNHLTLTADVGGPGLKFKGDLLDVYDPLSQRPLGAVLVLNGESNKNKLRIKVNLDLFRLAHSLDEAQLPNNSPFPTLDYDSIQVLPAGESSRVYLLEKNKKYTLGIALVIPEFDILINQISGSQIIFNLENQTGVGGFFTSKEKSKSGMLIFKPVDIDSNKWITQKISDHQSDVLMKQIHSWQKKKTKFRIK